MADGRFGLAGPMAWARGFLAAAKGRARRITARVLANTSSKSFSTSSTSTLATSSSTDIETELPTTKRSRPAFVYGVKQLVAVFLLEAVIMTSMCAATGGLWDKSWHGTTLPDVWEIFGGHSEISLQASGMGWIGLHPIDLLYGTDLRQEEQRRGRRSRGSEQGQEMRRYSGSSKQEWWMGRGRRIRNRVRRRRGRRQWQHKEGRRMDGSNRSRLAPAV